MALEGPAEADEQALEAVDEGDRLLDRPAVTAEARAVVGAASGDAGPDAAPAKLAAMGPVVVGAIGVEGSWPARRPPVRSSDRGHPIEQRHQLSDVMAVAGAHAPGERDAGGVDQEVVLDPGTRAIYRARARLRAPLFAWAWVPSIAARDRSSASAARSSANSSACSAGQTPACCHSRRRRQQVIPEP